jgi:hypothetical protein
MIGGAKRAEYERILWQNLHKNVRFWLRKGFDHEFSGNFVPFVAKKQGH